MDSTCLNNEFAARCKAGDGDAASWQDHGIQLLAQLPSHIHAQLFPVHTHCRQRLFLGMGGWSNNREGVDAYLGNAGSGIAGGWACSSGIELLIYCCGHSFYCAMTANKGATRISRNKWEQRAPCRELSS